MYYWFVDPTVMLSFAEFQRAFVNGRVSCMPLGDVQTLHDAAGWLASLHYTKADYVCGETVEACLSAVEQYFARGGQSVRVGSARAARHPRAHTGEFVVLESGIPVTQEEWNDFFADYDIIHYQSYRCRWCPTVLPPDNYEYVYTHNGGYYERIGCKSYNRRQARNAKADLRRQAGPVTNIELSLICKALAQELHGEQLRVRRISGLSGKLKVFHQLSQLVVQCRGLRTYRKILQQYPCIVLSRLSPILDKLQGAAENKDAFMAQFRKWGVPEKIKEQKDVVANPSK